MSDVDQWKTVANSNGAAPPDGEPELMPRGSVNDAARERAAAVKRWYDDPGFRLPFDDYALVRVTGTHFTLADGPVESNASLLLEVGQRVKLAGAGADAGKFWEGFVSDTPAAPTYSSPTTTFHIEWIAADSTDAVGPTVSPAAVSVSLKELGRAAWYDTGASAGKVPLYDDLDPHVATPEASLDVGLLDGQAREAIMMDSQRGRLNPNGGLDRWSRGTAFDSTTDYTNDADNVCADAWTILSDANDRVDISRSSDVPAGEELLYSMRLEAATVPSNQKHGVINCIERFDAYDVASAGGTRRVSASFWAKFDAAATGIDTIRAYLVNIKTEEPSVTPVSNWQNGSAGVDVTLDALEWEIVASASVTLTASWQRFTPASLLDVLMDVSSAGSGAMALMFHVDEAAIASGAAWFLAGGQVNRGANALPFVRLPAAFERARCDRYFESTFDDAVRPGHGKGNAHSLIAMSSGVNIGADWRFSAEKFKTPTLVTYNPGDAAPTATENWRDSAGVDRVVSSSEASKRGAHILCGTATDALVHRVAAAAHANIWGNN